jgi:hypothetical protein
MESCMEKLEQEAKVYKHMTGNCPVLVIDSINSIAACITPHISNIIKDWKVIYIIKVD